MNSIGASELMIIFIMLGVFLIPGIFYLLTLQKALESVSPSNRKMPPGQVWLMFIPLFNAVWYFFVVDAIAVSFEREYLSRGVSCEPKPTYSVGLAAAILNVCGIIPFLGFFAMIAAFVCWIVHWVKVSETKNDIQRMSYQDLDTRPTIFQ